MLINYADDIHDVDYQWMEIIATGSCNCTMMIVAKKIRSFTKNMDLPLMVTSLNSYHKVNKNLIEFVQF